MAMLFLMQNAQPERGMHRAYVIVERVVTTHCQLPATDDIVEVGPDGGGGTIGEGVQLYIDLCRGGCQQLPPPRSL